ncbi:MAG: sigma-54-dependent Fis family transcriptional regulator [Deltaproteobacteria bacterium]|nr:sigma-54-dependent Fis family transcriptional regulator [Deltaproteobacteria bacterium]
MNYHIAVIDDEPSNLEALERILKSDGAEVSLFQDPHAALQYVNSHSIDVMMTDLRMNALDGMDVLDTVKRTDPSVEVILVTAYGTVELAVQAMRKGAYDFITKPLQRLHVLRAVHRALEKRRLVAENLSLREEIKTHLHSNSGKLMGKSEPMKKMMDVAWQTARSRANVLISGESGTGKALLAEYLHYQSASASGIFVKINCAAIPENLLEAELFGYEPGAFTGATKRKEGRIELAHGGTLFLDEVGIAQPAFQAKLLRFLQEGEFERLGSNKTLHVDTRVVSATNADLKAAISNGTFREDLYYRLNVVHIHVPPLRDRLEDIPLLAQKFLEESAKKNGRKVPLLHSEVLECLARYSWPGNVRELQNLIERTVVLNKTGVISVEELSPEIMSNQKEKRMVIPVGMPLRQVERMIMSETLKTARGDKKLAARLLGIHPRTIYRYLESSVQTPDCDEPMSEDLCG